MTWRPDLSERALSQLGGFPEEALDALAKGMAVVCDDPYDPLTTMSTDDPMVRRADFGQGRGFVTYVPVDSAYVVRVVDIIWVG
ncbi:hypothetical protein [Sphaerimonospora thailandensis]|uniref:Uncharacterized protein n=1 Tax=Sphaerimonospora thailandensis TaxID=795644 RepID=A0A8J3W290_9ACTN|nr:hypothetical protein [Sphaerimonospora thailandensis]GIH73025.1 hypothetical protein Mth01_52780 [Sphaerimonospora thailandensis]